MQEADAWTLLCNMPDVVVADEVGSRQFLTNSFSSVMCHTAP